MRKTRGSTLQGPGPSNSLYEGLTSGIVFSYASLCPITNCAIIAFLSARDTVHCIPLFVLRKLCPGTGNPSLVIVVLVTVCLASPCLTLPGFAIAAAIFFLEQ